MTAYFEKKGDHKKQVFEIVKKELAKKEISTVVVATTQGDTALYAAKTIPEANIIAVTHQAGFREPGGMEIEEKIIHKLKTKNVKVLTATHALAGVGRAIRKKHGTWQISELIADSLRIFGQGTKVAVEIVLMAADAGLIPIEDVIAVAGTGRSADTAWVIRPAHTSNFFDLRMKKLLCKPLKF